MRPRPDVQTRDTLAYGAKDAVGRRLFQKSEVQRLCGSTPAEKLSQYYVLAAFSEIVSPESRVKRDGTHGSISRVLNLLLSKTELDFHSTRTRSVTLRPRSRARVAQALTHGVVSSSALELGPAFGRAYATFVHEVQSIHEQELAEAAKETILSRIHRVVNGEVRGPEMPARMGHAAHVRHLVVLVTAH